MVNRVGDVVVVTDNEEYCRTDGIVNGTAFRMRASADPINNTPVTKPMRRRLLLLRPPPLDVDLDDLVRLIIISFLSAILSNSTIVLYAFFWQLLFVPVVSCEALQRYRK